MNVVITKANFGPCKHAIVGTSRVDDIETFHLASRIHDASFGVARDVESLAQQLGGHHIAARDRLVKQSVGYREGLHIVVNDGK